MPLSERGYLALGLAVLALVGAAGVYVNAYILLGAAPDSVGGGVYVESYTASLDGLRLVEEYVYRVGEAGYTMLYRSWDAPIPPPGGEAGDSYVAVEDVRCPPGMAAYYVDEAGRVHSLDALAATVIDAIQRKVSDSGAANEAGCYAPRGIEPGVYRVRYVFALHAPLKCGPDGCFADILLARAGDRLDYAAASIEVRGAVDARVSPSLPWARLEAVEGAVLVEASPVPEGRELRLLILYPGPPDGHGAVEEVPSARGALEEALGSLTLRVETARALAAVDLAVLAASPLVMLAVYYRYGRERRPSAVIPRGFPPDTGEAPWEVALLYAGDPGVPDEKVLAAIMADLAARGVLQATVGPRGEAALRLPEGEPGELSEIERATLDLLRAYSEGGVVSEETIKSRVRAARRDGELRRRLVAASRAFESTARRIGRELAERALEHAPLKPVAALYAGAIAASLAGLVAVPGMNDWATRFLADLGLSIAVLTTYGLLPGHVLGRWRPGYLERYLAWVEFAERAKRMGAPPRGGAPAGRLGAYLAAFGLVDELERLGGALAASVAVYRGLRRHRAIPGAAGGGGGGGGGFGGGGAGAR